MSASSNYSLKYGNLPEGLLGRSFNVSLKYGNIPENNLRQSSNYAIETDFNLDVGNTIEFSDDAAGDAIANLLRDGNNTIEFDTIAQEQSIRIRNAENTVQFSQSDQLNTNVDVVADNIISLNATADHSVVMELVSTAESTISFSQTSKEIVGTFDNGIIVHGAIIHRSGNIGTQGGSADLTRALMIGGLSSSTQITFVSSSPNDTMQVYLVEGVSSLGISVSESVQLGGTNLISTESEYIRINKITKTEGPSLIGLVTISNPTSTVLGTLYPILESGASTETTSLQGMFNGIIGTPDETITYYEKFFIRNSTLENVEILTVEEFSDTNDCTEFALDLDKNQNTTSSDRLTAPLGVSDFNSLPKTIIDFEPGDAIGVWVRLRVPLGSPILLKTYILRISADGVEQLAQIVSPEASSEFVADVFERRSNEPVGGGNPLRFMELRGAQFVEERFYEPDPVTFRSRFYYNTRLNRLYKKIDTKPVPVWKQVR